MQHRYANIRLVCAIAIPSLLDLVCSFRRKLDAHQPGSRKSTKVNTGDFFFAVHPSSLRCLHFFILPEDGFNQDAVTWCFEKT